MDNKLATILALYDESAALKDAYTIPAAWYLDVEMERLERKHVFGGNWQAIARTEQLAEAGNYITAEFGGEPILAVRGADGKLRAFYNVCRHHAAAVATAPCGHAQSFRCPIMAGTTAWTAASKACRSSRVCATSTSRPMDWRRWRSRLGRNLSL